MAQNPISDAALVKVLNLLEGHGNDIDEVARLYGYKKGTIINYISIAKRRGLVHESMGVTPMVKTGYLELARQVMASPYAKKSGANEG